MRAIQQRREANDWQLRDFRNIELFHFLNLVGKMRSTCKVTKQYRASFKCKLITMLDRFFRSSGADLFIYAS